MTKGLAFVLAAALAGCASTSADDGMRDVAQTALRRTGHSIAWATGGPEDERVDRAVHALLARDLTAEGAVAVALLNNRGLHATYEELSVAQADVVQAGLLQNPVFAASMTTAERDAIDPNVIFGVTQDFLDLLMIPARKKVAAAQFEQVRLRVTDAVLEVARDARAAFYTLQGAEQVLAMRRTVAQAAEVSADLAARQHESGNISDLALATEEGLFEQIRLDAARSEVEIATARERLVRILALWGADASLRVAARLPDLPPDEVPVEHLESLAISQRLDLAAMRKQAETLAYALSLAKSSRFTGAIDVGADVARLKDGSWAVGPRASIELPIFDQRQAVIARLEALVRASEARVAQLAIDVRSEVREARERVLHQRRLAQHYRTVVIPLRERIVALSQQEYDAMLLGAYQLILAKQGEVNAYREYIESVRDYWIARADLERRVGGRLLAPSEIHGGSP